MDISKNTFKAGLDAGMLQIGLWSILSSHVTVEILAGAGFDWLVLDTEHAPNDMPMVYSQLQAAKAGGKAHPMVRVPWNDMVTIKQYLDIGVQSFLIPQVQTAEEARAAVSFTRYPPHGVRGFSAAPRANQFGRIKNYAKTCENEIAVIVQIETQQALDNIEKIAAVDGVTGLFIGPGDLSAALGHIGEPNHPDMVTITDAAITRIIKAGKPAGILAPVEAMARHYIDQGCLFVAVGSDLGILARTTEQLAAKFKA